MRLSEIVDVSGLSRPTVETVADGLVQQGWIRIDSPEEGTGRRSPGRPARRYSFNATAGHVVGVDIGAHTVSVRLANLRGEPLGDLHRPVTQTTAAEERLRRTREAVFALLAREGVGIGNVFAMVVGTPGTVAQGEQHVGKSPGLEGWTNLDIVTALQETIACPIELENDANLAAVAECASGVARDASDVLFLLLGERLGAGVITNGRLVRGSNGAAGELGHAPYAGPLKRPPGLGAFESQVNASAILSMGRRYFAAGTGSRLGAFCGDDAAELTTEMVTRAAAEGDPAARRALRSIARTLAKGLASPLLTLNPEILVIGGGISRAGRIITDLLEPELQKLLLFPPAIRLSTLGNDGVLVGAVQQAVERVQTDILDKVSA